MDRHIGLDAHASSCTLGVLNTPPVNGLKIRVSAVQFRPWPFPLSRFPNH